MADTVFQFSEPLVVKSTTHAVKAYKAGKTKARDREDDLVVWLFALAAGLLCIWAYKTHHLVQQRKKRQKHNQEEESTSMVHALFSLSMRARRFTVLMSMTGMWLADIVTFGSLARVGGLFCLRWVFVKKGAGPHFRAFRSWQGKTLFCGLLLGLYTSALLYHLSYNVSAASLSLCDTQHPPNPHSSSPDVH